MLALAVETSTDAAAVALADEAGLLASFVVARGRHHTETVVPAIAALCRRVGLTPADLDVLGVDVGPGLFAGLRVGVATVQALAFALDLPVATATSFEVLAHAAAAAVPGAALVVPVVDARRGQVFSARFAPAPAPPPPVAPVVSVAPAASAASTDVAADVRAVLRAVGPETTLSVDELVAELAAAAPSCAPGPVVVVGDGAARYRPQLAAVAGVVLPDAVGAPPVETLARLTVADAVAGRVRPGPAVVPHYLRPADTRIRWETRRGLRKGA